MGKHLVAIQLDDDASITIRDQRRIRAQDGRAGSCVQCGSAETSSELFPWMCDNGHIRFYGMKSARCGNCGILYGGSHITLPTAILLADCESCLAGEPPVLFESERLSE